MIADLSYFLLELIQNSIEADAKHIRICVKSDGGTHRVTVSDDGRGMDEEALLQIKKKGYSSKEGNRGKGLYLAASQAEGFEVKSKKGEGTEIRFTLRSMPVGNVGLTVCTALAGAPRTDIELSHSLFGKEIRFSTERLKAELSVESLENADVLFFVKSCLAEQYENFL